jgi:hypothetical protein
MYWYQYYKSEHLKFTRAHSAVPSWSVLRIKPLLCDLAQKKEEQRSRDTESLNLQSEHCFLVSDLLIFQKHQDTPNFLAISYTREEASNGRCHGRRRSPSTMFWGYTERNKSSLSSATATGLASSHPPGLRSPPGGEPATFSSPKHHLSLSLS